MNTVVWIIIVIALVLAGLGILVAVRRQIAATREDLKHVDRSKLRDLDDDAWAKEERDQDDRKS